MTKIDDLVLHLNTSFEGSLLSMTKAYGEVTVECSATSLKAVVLQLRDDALFSFDQLVDLCAVDYLSFGEYDWETEPATDRGFSRAVERQPSPACSWNKPRFAVVYHLLSTTLNHRLRLKVFLDESHLVVPSVHDVWKGANWFEREAYDLFGVLFDGHPDLRRILTDYGFIGHPFRKDFPVSGHVEMRYDAALGKVIYEPVDLEPRTSVPKVIRDDNRYMDLPQPGEK